MELNHLPEVFESRVRIAILAILIKETSRNFTQLKKFTNTAEGNLSAHLRRLEEAGYLTSLKQFINLRPQTTYTITEKGRNDFREYILVLEKLIND